MFIFYDASWIPVISLWSGIPPAGRDVESWTPPRLEMWKHPRVLLVNFSDRKKIVSRGRFTLLINSSRREKRPSLVMKSSIRPWYFGPPYFCTPPGPRLVILGKTRLWSLCFVQIFYRLYRLLYLQVTQNLDYVIHRDRVQFFSLPGHKFYPITIINWFGSRNPILVQLDSGG